MLSRLNLKDDLMKKWHSYWETALSDIQQKKLRMLFDGGNLLFFFRYDNDVFGAPELSRVTFAKLKDSGDEDNTPGWRKEASFTATNLTKLASGMQQTMLFTDKDVSKIDVLSKDEAMRALEESLEREK